jgi:hypothetical protein
MNGEPERAVLGLALRPALGEPLRVRAVRPHEPEARARPRRIGDRDGHGLARGVRAIQPHDQPPVRVARTQAAAAQPHAANVQLARVELDLVQRGHERDQRQRRGALELRAHDVDCEVEREVLGVEHAVAHGALLPSPGFGPLGRWRVVGIDVENAARTEEDGMEQGIGSSGGHAGVLREVQKRVESASWCWASKLPSGSARNA